MIRWVTTFALLGTLSASAITREAEFRLEFTNTANEFLVPFSIRKDPSSKYYKSHRKNEHADGRTVPRAGIEGVGDGNKLNPTGPMKTTSLNRPSSNELEKFLKDHFTKLNLSKDQINSLDKLVEEVASKEKIPGPFSEHPCFWIDVIDRALLRLANSEI